MEKEPSNRKRRRFAPLRLPRFISIIRGTHSYRVIVYLYLCPYPLLAVWNVLRFHWLV